MSINKIGIPILTERCRFLAPQIPYLRKDQIYRKHKSRYGNKKLVLPAPYDTSCRFYLI